MRIKQLAEYTVNVPAMRLSINLTEKSTRTQVLKEVDRVFEELHKNEQTGQVLDGIRGHLLAIVQEQELYKPDHASFERYMAAMSDRFGAERATLRNELKIAIALPDLTQEEYKETPRANLLQMARAVKAGATQKQLSVMRQQAKLTPIKEFREKLAEAGLIPKKENGLVSLTLHLSERAVKAWRDFKGDQTDEEALMALLLEWVPGVRKRRVA